MTLSKKSLEKILPNPSLDPVRKIRFLTEKSKASTYIISTFSHRYILTLFNQDQFDPKRLIETNNTLNDLGFPLPKIINYGLIDNKKALLTNYHHGKVINYLLPQHYEKIGYLLGSLHQVTESIIDAPLSIPMIINLRMQFEVLKPKIPKEFHGLESLLQSIENAWPLNLPTGLIHGDVWYKNLLFYDDEITALLNYTHPTCDLLILDLAGLIKGLHGTKEGRKSCENLLTSYQKARPLSLKEIEAIDVVVKAKFFSTVVQNIEKSDFDPSARNEFYAVAYMNFLKLQQIHEKDYSTFIT